MTSNPSVLVTGPEPEPSVVDALLRELPDWFGIEAAVEEYVRRSATLDTFVARSRDDHGAQGGPEAVGVLVLDRHFAGEKVAQSAEVAVMAVRRDWHRQGVGRTLLTAAEQHLRDRSVRMLYVKTLGPSHPDPGYAATRTFYLAAGFVPLEELAGVWPDDPCLVLAKPLAGGEGAGPR